MNMDRFKKIIIYAAATNTFSQFVESKLEKLRGPKSSPGLSSPSEQLPSKKPNDATKSKSSGFKEQYVAAKNVQERQQLILQYAQKPKQLHPVIVELSKGNKLVYYVMPDYLMIDGQLASVTPQTAQILAKKWGMVLPTGKMVEQIHDEARQTGGALRPSPLSASGYYDPVTGKKYTAEEVARSRISAPGANIAYSERIQKEKDKNPNAPIYSGHGKTIIQPLEQDTGQIFFKGIPVEQNGKIMWVQRGTSGAHGASARDVHEEYITGMQAASDEAEILKPDGTKMKISLKKLMSHPKFYAAVSEKPGVVEYKTPSGSVASAPISDPSKKV